jgi:heme a synthase
MVGYPQKIVTVWLLTLSLLIVVMIVFGGYVRLTRSGLSIVEWNVVTGILPPMSDEAWQATFAKYQQTPEFQKVNFNMTLAQYRRIFYIEYFHRLLGRVTGLIVILPLAFFLVTGAIQWRRSAIYWAIALLFVLQGFMGWYMVSSGLVNQPSVSPYRLTAHLLLALLLLGLTLWIAFDQLYSRAVDRRAANSRLHHAASLLLVLLVVQIAYGGLVAGMKAGHVSDTFPLMFGYLVPPGIFSVLQPWWRNMISDMAAVHFIHRWLAFVVLAVASFFCWIGLRRALPKPIPWALIALAALLLLQVILGIGVIWLHVPLLLALLHQFLAICLFIVLLFLKYRLRFA